MLWKDPEIQIEEQDDKNDKKQHFGWWQKKAISWCPALSQKQTKSTELAGSDISAMNFTAFFSLWIIICSWIFCISFYQVAMKYSSPRNTGLLTPNLKIP